jgi:endo-1,4-beta-xylanase
MICCFRFAVRGIRFAVRGFQFAVWGARIAGCLFWLGLVGSGWGRDEAGRLGAVFAPGFLVGTAVPSRELAAGEEALLLRHFRAVTPENCMKMAEIQPVEGDFRFALADKMVEAAVAAGQEVTGHALVWHEQCPDWLFKDGENAAGRELLRERMRRHILTLVGRYRGRVKSWDVVNEAVDDGDGYLRATPWLVGMGPDYLVEAFRAAREADPAAALYYNDYNIEREPKRGKVLRLIRELKAQGVTLDGVGIQGHWQLDAVPYADIEAAIMAFHAEGVPVMITELDLDVVPRAVDGAAIGVSEAGADDPFLAGLPEAVDRRLAEQYAVLFGLFWKHRDKISRVTLWGLHDGMSWLNTWPRVRTNHALLFDRNLREKRAFWEVLEVVR